MKKIISILLLFVAIVSTAQTKEERYDIKNLNINNAYSNFGTSFYGEDKLIYAAPAKRNFIINNTWKGNNQPFLDLYEGTINESGELTDVKKFSSKINTKFHESDVTFTNDKQTVYFSRSNYFKGRYKKDSLGINRIKMFKASVAQNGEWINVESMPFNDDNYSVGHPTLSEDQKTLYFVSDMPGTFGRTDVFKVEIYNDGTYGAPINLGPEVNTPGREMFPYIDGNDELYFSSDGRDEGLGMLDVYVCKLDPERILKPIHLGNNINSDRDDFAFIINKDKREGYFSSNRRKGRGDDDIYYFKEKKPIIFVPTIIECNQIVNVIVRNKKTGEILPGSYLTILKDGEEIVEHVKVNEEGAYLIDADCEVNYQIKASNNYFLSASKSFETSSENNLTSEVVIELSPDEFVVVREKVMININNIYFDYDKSDIRKEAALELDKVVLIMNKYPELIVESDSHTDSRGPDIYNLNLSDRRALSTVKYIISRGISPDRISGKGYGETQLTNKCSNGVRCSKEDHQLNRRTEFVIANPEVIK